MGVTYNVFGGNIQSPRLKKGRCPGFCNGGRTFSWCAAIPDCCCTGSYIPRGGGWCGAYTQYQLLTLIPSVLDPQRECSSEGVDPFRENCSQSRFGVVYPQIQGIFSPKRDSSLPLKAQVQVPGGRSFATRVARYGWKREEKTRTNHANLRPHLQMVQQ